MGTSTATSNNYLGSTSGSPGMTPQLRPSKALTHITRLLAQADVQINGERPWDMQIHDAGVIDRILAQGSLGLGESYMDGAWDCAALDQFFARVLAAALDRQVSAGLALQSLRARLTNLQNARRAWQVGEVHYDTGNEFFTAMLDSRMTYTCGYWAEASNLEEAQFAKLDLICRKLGLQPGMRMLDIGCGWGSLMQFAAEYYGVHCVGLTVSKEQAELGRARAGQLPIEFHLVDYRSFNSHGEQTFDRVASIGMFEHVGHKNYAAFFEMAKRSLKEDGLFLLHTIGKNQHGGGTDPWINRYIFPNGEIPSLYGITGEVEDHFVIEDLHNFGADYDHTLMAWNAHFETAWPRFADRYGERFHRMWRYYLLSCAGAFRARELQLWQFVLSPRGVPGGYRRPA